MAAVDVTAPSPLPASAGGGGSGADGSDADDEEARSSDEEAAAAAAGGGTPLDAANPAAVVTEEVVVRLPSPRGAAAAATALGADAELRPRRVTKALRVDGCTLHVLFRATDARALRQSVGSFREHAALVVDAVTAFAPR